MSADSSGQSDQSAVGTAPAEEREGSNGYDRNRIAMRAYELYLQRGATDGCDFDDWLAAERELAGATDSSEGEGRG